MCLPFLVITFSCRHPSTEKRTMPHHSCQRALLPVDDDTKQWKPSLKRTLDEWLPAGHEERFRGAGKGKLELTARHLGPGRLRGSSPIERVFPLSVMPVGLNASAFSFSHPQRRPSPTAFPCDKEPRGTRPSHRPQSAHRARGGKGDGETRPDDLAASALPQRHQADSQRGGSQISVRGSSVPLRLLQSAAASRRRITLRNGRLVALGKTKTSGGRGWRGWRGWRGRVSLTDGRST